MTSDVQRNGTTQLVPPLSTTYRPVWFDPKDRRTFIGGSDARIIMGDDEARLIRLWLEKRGETDTGGPQREPDCPARLRHRESEPALV